MWSKKVSVIIPFYSGIEWLKEAVDSALAQSYSNIEIIVINDGSAEDISQFLNVYGNKITYIYQQNQGAGAARNLGMRYATGDYIAFLDADDLWHPQKLEKQISFMEQIKAVWSHTGFYYWYPSTNNLKLINNRSDFGDIRKKFYISMKVATPSVVISKAFLESHPECRFPENFRNGEDTQFYRSIANLESLALIREPLLKVRMRADNSYSQAVSRFKTNAMAFKKFKNDPNVPRIAKLNLGIYLVYSKILGSHTSPIKEKVAKFFWIFPFSIERIALKFYSRKKQSDYKYIN